MRTCNILTKVKLPAFWTMTTGPQRCFPWRDSWQEGDRWTRPHPLLRPGPHRDTGAEGHARPSRETASGCRAVPAIQTLLCPSRPGAAIIFFFYLFWNVFIFFHYQKTDYTNKCCVFVYPGTLQFSKEIILDGVSFFVFSVPLSWQPVFLSRPWLVRVLRKGAGTPAPRRLGFLQAWSSGGHLWKAGPHHCPEAPGGPPLSDSSSASSCLPETTGQARTDSPAHPWQLAGLGEQRPGGPQSPLPPDPSPRGVTWVLTLWPPASSPGR